MDNNINLENLYRGTIHTNTKFFLAARINDNTIGASTGIINNLNLPSNSSPHFLLCLDSREISGINYHHYYWSNDPVDFVPQFEYDARNQGAMELIFSTDENYNNTFTYNTNLNNNGYDNSINSYPLSNIKEDNIISPGKGDIFSLVPEESKNFNISNLLHSGVPYNLSKSDLKTLDWDFRANIETGASFRPPLATFVNNNNNVFTHLGSKAVRISGTTSFSGDEQLSLNGFTTTVNYLTEDEIPINGGIALMTQNTNSEYFIYSYYDKDSKYITYGERALFDGTSFTPNTTDNLTVQIVLSNHVDNFKSLSSLISGSYSDTTNYLEVFFIPANGDSFLSGGVNLENITNYNLPSQAVDFYNYKENYEYINGESIRDLSFFSNYLNKTLPPNFKYSKDGEISYPLVPVYSPSNDVNSSNSLLWTSRHESITSHYYNYCRGDDLCGNCMGSTKDKGFYCHSNHMTIENYKNSTAVGNNDTLGELPLSQDPKKSQTKNIFHNYTIPIVVGSVIIFFTLMTLVFILASREGRKNELSKLTG